MSEFAKAMVEARDAPSTIASSQREQSSLDHAVEETIRRWIKDSGIYAFYFSDVAYECSTGVLKIRGCVPTHRLKNVLWSFIRGLDGVTEIDDELAVVSSTGLSSVPPREALFRCGAKSKEGHDDSR